MTGKIIDWRALLEFLRQCYNDDEFPALLDQVETWGRERPFAGKRLLDATPVFRNTLAKYLPLLAGGADLTVGFGEGIPCASGIQKLLERFGISCDVQGNYDVVLDCAGAFRNVPVRAGYVELTRSGFEAYRNATSPVFFADGGKIKTIETALGTGDGFRRGLAALGYTDIRGRRILVFGCGKVGRGIVISLKRFGAVPVVVDDLANVQPPDGVQAIDRHDKARIDRELASAWCMVSATGVKHALAESCDWTSAMASPLLMANMGVEDEFGPDIPAERVLNRKQPLNFLCEEPTRIMYIDPTMALSNFGAWKLLHENTLRQGLNWPSPQDEEHILAVVRQRGAAAAEVAELIE